MVGAVITAPVISCPMWNLDPLALTLFGWCWRLILRAKFVSEIKQTLLFARGRAINFSMVNHMLLAHNKVKRDLFIYTCLNSWCIYLFRTVLCTSTKFCISLRSGICLCCEWHLLLFPWWWFSFASHSVMNCTVIGYTLIFLPLFESPIIIARSNTENYFSKCAGS